MPEVPSRSVCTSYMNAWMVPPLTRHYNSSSTSHISKHTFRSVCWWTHRRDKYNNLARAVIVGAHTLFLSVDIKWHMSRRCTRHWLRWRFDRVLRFIPRCCESNICVRLVCANFKWRREGNGEHRLSFNISIHTIAGQSARAFHYSLYRISARARKIQTHVKHAFYGDILRSLTTLSFVAVPHVHLNWQRFSILACRSSLFPATLTSQQVTSHIDRKFEHVGCRVGRAASERERIIIIILSNYRLNWNRGAARWCNWNNDQRTMDANWASNNAKTHFPPFELKWFADSVENEIRVFFYAFIFISSSLVWALFVIHLCCWHCRNRRHHTLLLLLSSSPSSSSLSAFDFGTQLHGGRRPQLNVWKKVRTVRHGMGPFLHLYFSTFDLISD